MIELPESQNLAKQIKDNLLGKIVSEVTVNQSPHKFAWFHKDPESYNDMLKGKTITDTHFYGGYVEIAFEELFLELNDGVNIRYFESHQKLPPKHQTLITFTDDTSLVLSVQMYGGICLMENPEESSYFAMAKNRISPLSNDNTQEYFFHLMDSVKQNLSIKAFLATEQRFPGLGNGVLQDILFNAKIHPKRKLESLSEDEKQSIYTSVKSTLEEMTKKGGRNVEKDIFGSKCGYQTILSAKTKDEPCPECGDFIARKAFLGGNVYYCPTCQKI